MTEIQKKKLNIEKQYLLDRKANADKLPPEVFKDWQDEYKKICLRLDEIDSQLEEGIRTRVHRLQKASYDLIMRCRKKGTPVATSIESYLDAKPLEKSKTHAAFEQIEKYFENGSDAEFNQQLQQFIAVWEQVLETANTPIQTSIYGKDVNNNGCPWKTA